MAENKSSSSKIKQKLSYLENFRIKKLKEHNRNIMICAVIVPILEYFCYDFLISSSENDFIGLMVFILFIACCYIYKPVAEYKKEYKEKVIPVLVEQLGASFKYSSVKYIRYSDVNHFKSIGYSNKESGEDMFEGKIEGIKVQFSECHFKRETGSGKHKSTTTIFDGLLCLTEFPFNFQSHTVVQKDAGKLINFLSSKISKFENIQLDDPDFEKEFEVYTNDRHGSFYLLSPAMMKNMLSFTNFVRKAHSKRAKVGFEFYNNQMLIKVEKIPNLFEPAGIRTSAYNLEILPVMKNQIKAIATIIHHLKLDYFKDRKVAVNNANK